MKNLKVVAVTGDEIQFEGGVSMYSDHRSDCCEWHELTLGDLKLSDFDGLEFDLSGDDFFKRVPGFGIELIPVFGHPVRIPGHGSNNGYYSSNLQLCVKGPGISKEYDITECQDEDSF